jgi:hypothetical protein
MHTPAKQTRYFKVIAILAVFVVVGMYSCNNSTSTDVKKDSAVTSAPDTTMKMKADSVKVDTAGKGGQAAPTGH